MNTLTPHTVNRRPRQLQKLNDETFKAREEKRAPARPAPTPGSAVIAATLEDAELLEKALKLDWFARLWNGDWSDYPSQSEADFDLSKSLLWWTGHDLERADALFRKSRLLRGKWDERHGDSTYGKITLKHALERVNGQYIRGYSEIPPRQDDIPPLSGDARLLAKIESLSKQVIELEAQLAQERTERQLLLAVQRNNKIKAERNTALAVLFEVQSARSRGMEDEQGYAHVSNRELSIKAGVSRRAVSEHTKRLETWGVLSKDHKRGEGDVVNPSTGELIAHPTQLWVKLNGTPQEYLNRLATLDPERESTHGGKRTPRCPVHPDADIIMTTTWQCSVCAEDVKLPRVEILPPEVCHLDIPPWMLRASPTTPTV